MAVVKGTKTPRLAVVPYRPYLKPLLIGGIASALLVVAVLSYWAGNYFAIASQDNVVKERDQLKIDLAEQQKEAEELSQQVTNLSLAREVDKASTEDVRGEVIKLKEEIAALNEDISFYRGLMSPTDNQSGLTIGSVDVIATSVPRQFNFKIVMQQLATNHELLSGSLVVTVIGKENDLPRSYLLKDLSQQVEEESIKLRYKYFQNIEGQMDIPYGFEPERIELVAKSTGRNPAAVEKKFGWLVQEN